VISFAAKHFSIKLTFQNKWEYVLKLNQNCCILLVHFLCIFIFLFGNKFLFHFYVNQKHLLKTHFDFFVSFLLIFYHDDDFLYQFKFFAFNTG
jgi:hypothetical protein